MSTTIDQKVVEMRFDNKNFESNVKETMSTLDKFKQKLNLTGASKGLENINTASKKIDMSGMGNAIDTVRNKFSTLEVMGITALANITNSAVNAGKRIASALTIDPIMTGFSEYETKINAIQTIMSNTANKGTTMDDVTKVLNELNTYADKTIYNFAEMTRNIGTFTAAGVGLEDSASAIQGIANLAAASGSSSQQASTAMYQLSQALASGSVKLMDWNSVVNAGMGGQKFQEALKATAREHGVNVDSMIKKSGSFRESLKEEWITAEILNETLSKFTVDGAKKYSDAMMKSGKWTQAQADALMKEAQSMEDAATKVKTFTQLWDTLKESAQSGWAQSWEIIVGNFDEAKDLLTEISDTIGGVLNKSAESRNKVLQEWKELGGRTAIVESLRNTFEGIASIVKPVKEAFREIFPPITAQQLLDFSNGLKNLTSKLKLSEDTAEKLKSTFKGVFSIIDIGFTFIKDIVGGVGKLLGSFTGVTGGILGASASLGDWLSNLRDSIKAGDAFGKAIDKIVGFLQNGIEKIKEFAGPGFKGLFGVLTGIWELVTKIGSSIGKFLGESLREGDIVAGIEVLNAGLFSGILLGIKNFIGNFSESFEGIKDVLGSFKGILESYQQDLQANTLLKIASAIGILAVSLLLLASIKPEKLNTAIVALSVLFGELLGSLAIFGKVAGNVKHVLKASAGLIALSSAMLILAAAMKIMSTMSWSELGVGLTGTVVGLLALVGAVRLLPETKVTKAASAIKKLCTALLIFSVAMKIMASMSWNELAIGLTGVVAGLGALVATVRLLPKNTGARVAGMIGLATSLVILGGALKIMASMSWSDIGRGLTVTVAGLASLVAAVRLLPKDTGIKAIGLIGLATALTILGGALKIMGSMSWEEIGRGLAVLGGALLELVIALNLMRGAVSGAAALLIASTSIVMLAGSLKLIGAMSWESIIKGLVGLAGAFTIIGVAGLLLAPMVPTLLGLAGAFVLFGAATLGIGVGLGLIAAGISALALSLSVGTTAIVAGLSAIVLGLVGLIPEIVKILGDTLVVLCGVIVEAAPMIAETILVVVDKIFAALAKYTPSIVTSLLQFLIGVLQSLRDHLPDLIVVAVEVIGAFFNGIVAALKGIDPSSLLQGVLGLTLLTGLIFMLSSIATFIPGAMVGVLGLSMVIAELALVLAAIGAFAQIPGLSWLIEQGGNFLQKIGTAIGQFIGGIMGGISLGATSTLPQVGKNLSDFMTNLLPFIEGVKSIDSSVIKSVGSLVGAIVLITGANIIEGIASFVTGESSISKFASELPVLGQGLKSFAESLGGVDVSAIGTAASAAKALAEMTATIPNEGGVAAWFAGENSIASWADQLPILGTGLKMFSTSIAGMDSTAVSAAAGAAKALAEMTATIPNEGGVAAWFAGENSVAKWAHQLPVLGVGLKMFSTAIAGMDATAVSSAATAAKAIAEMTATIPNEGGMVAWFTGDNSIAKFATELVVLGVGLKMFSTAIAGMDSGSVTAATTAAKAIAEMTTTIPNDGGMVAWFTGDNSLAKWAHQLPVLGVGLKLFSTAIGGMDVNAVSLAAGAAKSIAEMTSIIPNEGGVVAWFTGDNSVEKWADKLPILGNGLKSFSETLNGVNVGNLAIAAMAAKQLAQITEIVPENTGYLENFGKNIVKFAKKVKEFVNHIGEVGSDSISSAIDKTKELLEMAKTVADTNIDSIKTFGESLKKFAKEGVEGFVKEFSGNDPKDKAKKAVGEMIKSAIKGAEDKKEDVKSAFKSLAKEATDALDDNKFKEKAKQAGLDLCQGLINGLNNPNKRNSVYAAAYSLGQLAVQGEKDGQQSNSPSKATEKAGVWLGEGLVIGIKQMGSKVYNAGRSMGEEATNSISKALDSAINLLNSDMDTQPTIRPVLDLSDVESGVGYLGSMFNNGPSLAVATNLGVISSGMNRRNQNGNDDVVLAINKLRKDLSNVGGDTYNVNGITYDDGSNVTEAVKTLVRAANIERRR